MKYLLLDTSTNIAKIGLVNDDELIADRSIDGKKNLSSNLLVEIEKVLLSGHSGPLRVGIEASSARIKEKLNKDDSGQAGMTKTGGSFPGLAELDGIIIYLGPGSYTGLRIGVTIANTFSYSLKIPVVGIKGESFGKEKFETSKMEPQNLEELYKKGKLKMKNAKAGTTVIPFYGKGPNVGGK